MEILNPISHVKIISFLLLAIKLALFSHVFRDVTYRVFTELVKMDGRILMKFNQCDNHSFNRTQANFLKFLEKFMQKSVCGKLSIFMFNLPKGNFGRQVFIRPVFTIADGIAKIP